MIVYMLLSFVRIMTAEMFYISRKEILYTNLENVFHGDLHLIFSTRNLKVKL